MMIRSRSFQTTELTELRALRTAEKLVCPLTVP